MREKKAYRSSPGFSIRVHFFAGGICQQWTQGNPDRSLDEIPQHIAALIKTSGENIAKAD